MNQAATWTIVIHLRNAENQHVDRLMKGLARAKPEEAHKSLKKPKVSGWTFSAESGIELRTALHRFSGDRLKSTRKKMRLLSEARSSRKPPASHRGFELNKLNRRIKRYSDARFTSWCCSAQCYSRDGWADSLLLKWLAIASVVFVGFINESHG